MNALDVVEDVLFSGCRAGVIRVWSTVTNDCLRVYTGHTGNYFYVCPRHYFDDEYRDDDVDDDVLDVDYDYNHDFSFNVLSKVPSPPSAAKTTSCSRRLSTRPSASGPFLLDPSSKQSNLPPFSTNRFSACRCITVL